MKNLIEKIVKKIKEIINKIITFFKKLFNKIKDFINRKKTQKNKVEKVKQYNKIEIIFKSVCGFFISIFESLFKSKKKDEEINISRELKTINRNILEIENQIKKENKPVTLKMYKKNLKENLNKIKRIRKKKSDENSEQLLLNLKDKINLCENKINTIKQENENSNNSIEVKVMDKKPQIKENNINNKIKNDKKEKSIIKKENLNKKENKLKTNKKLNFINKQFFNKVITNTKNGIKNNSFKVKKGAIVATTVTIGAVKSLFKKTDKKIVNKNKKQTKEKGINNSIKNEVKRMNFIINNSYQEIQNIKSKNYDDGKELELLVLKDKILDLKREYYDLTRKPEFKDIIIDKTILNIDTNHLIYHDKSIDNLIDYIDASIKNVKTKINENKKEKKIQNNFVIEIKQLKLINRSIDKDVKISKEEIVKIKKQINKTDLKNKKPTIIGSLFNFFKNSISVGMSLLPFSIFKNKFLATLTSGIILNNRIRYMRGIINNQDSDIDLINYEFIVNSIHDKKSCLEKTNYVLENTINEVSNLKEELMIICNYDIESVMYAKALFEELDEMEKDLEDENKNICNILEEMNELNKKGKQKIKRKI